MGLRNLYIDNTQLFDSSSYTAANSYTNAYASITAQVFTGKTYIFKVVTRFYPQTVKMWIDYNKNDTFENAEVTFFNKSFSGGVNTFTYTPNICNDSFRVRLLVDYASFYNGSGTDVDPCKVYYGDVLDFKMVMKSLNAEDIGLTAFLSPFQMNIGMNPVTVKMKNFGNTRIDSVRAYYRVNGGNIIEEHVSNIQLNSCNEYIYTFQDSLQASNGAYQVKSWVKYPNGNHPDANAVNDTIERYSCVPLNGNYTINTAQASGGTNFKSFKDAFDVLNNCGISGPVYFTVAPGIYKDSVILQNISGTSATHNIVFDGVDTTNRILTAYNSDIIHLNESKYITFKHLTFRAGSNVNYALVMDGNCENITVDSCNFTSSRSSLGAIITIPSNNTKGIITSNYIQLTHNRIYNYGFYGIYLVGSYTQDAYGNKVIGNYIQNCSTGFRANYQDTLLYTQNTIQDYISEGSAFFVGNVVEVSQNTIVGKATALSFLAIYTGKVYNNITSTENSNVFSLQITKSRDLGVYHNTMFHAGNLGDNTHINLCSKIDFRNNLMVNSGTGSYIINVAEDTQFTHFDYNQYYNLNKNSKYIYFIGDYADIQSFNGAFGYNRNSYGSNPNLVKTSVPRNLHLLATTMPAYGDSNVNITTDIDGDPRCIHTPTIGADESKYLQGQPVASFILPDTIYINSPARFKNLGSITYGQHFEWFVDAATTPTSNATDLIYSFTTIGAHQIQLKTYNCFNADDTTITIQVVKPIHPPAPNFTSDTTIVDSLGIVYFTDLSTGGAVSWRWALSGKRGIDYDYIQGTDSFSQNLVIQFYRTGAYEVCLTVGNSVGSAQLCRPQYIQVYIGAMMCKHQVVSAMNGHFYDEGGKWAYYPFANSTSCNMLISPCAGAVTLNFQRLNFDTNTASVKIYDGTSITGVLLNKYQVKTGVNYIAKSGSMYIEWNASFGSYAGWEATWNTVAKYIPKIPATIVSKDTAYLQATHAFEPKYYLPGMNYMWDFNGDGTIDQTGRYVTYKYTTIGIYTATCYAESCSGIDTAYQQVTVVQPLQLPNPVDFVMDVTGGNACQLKKLNIYTVEAAKTVLLYDRSGNGPTAWEWRVVNSTGNYTWDNGNTIQNPSITFNDTGYYSIQLKVTNTVGSNTKIFNQTVHVVSSHCMPSILTSANDYGITKVIFNDLINKSKPNSLYSDYTSTMSTCVESRKKYGVVITRAANISSCKIGVWIDYNQNGIFGSNELVLSTGGFTGISYIDSITIPAFSNAVLFGSTVMRIGIVPTSSTLNACGNNGTGEYEDYSIYITDDRTLPVITLLNKDTVDTELGLTYKDAGAIAYDNIDGYIPYTRSGMVNTQTEGYYILKFDAQDQAGNNAIPVYRTVHVHDDHTAPVIKIIGSNPFYHPMKKVYTDLGATAYDSADGVVNVVTVSNNVVDSVVGLYQVKYKATDSRGNSDSALRQVFVTAILDTVAPNIYLKGADTLYIEVKHNYQEPGVTIFDSIDQNPVLKIIGTVNTNLIDTFELIYIATDFSGNAAQVKRIVIVRKTSKPRILLLGSDTVYLQVMQAYNDPGVVLLDSFYTDFDLRPNLKTGTDFPNPAISIGHYTSWYHVTDAQGNASDTIYRHLIVSANGIYTLPTDETLTIYPNPATNYFSISGSFSAVALLEIYNIEGKLLYKQTISQNQIVSTAGLASRMYIVRLGDVYRRLVVSKK